MNEVMRAIIFTVSLLILTANTLNNGLARRPPMGWLTWERFLCNTDCNTYPNDCISEKLFTDMVDMMISGGYAIAGYEYVIIDDCWLAKSRDVEGRLQADPKRFPHGIKALADYAHKKGLKFGIYEDFGTHTCAGYPGSEYYLQLDAETFANWTVDYFKFDGCNSDIKQYDDAFPAMGYWLNKTGRPIVYTTAWPKYQESSHLKPNYAKIAEFCNTWRNFDDINDSWDRVLSIIQFYGSNKNRFAEVAGPGNFNDPDVGSGETDSVTTVLKTRESRNLYAFKMPIGIGHLLVIGNFGLSYDQQRSQMAMWSILAAPLIMSVDLRTIEPKSRALLLNQSAISINQDPLGYQGRLVAKSGKFLVWTKAILPKGSWAFAFLNIGSSGYPRLFSIQLSDFGLQSPSGYNITEVFDKVPIGFYMPTSKISVTINPTGVFFGKALIL